MMARGEITEQRRGGGGVRLSRLLHGLAAVAAADDLLITGVTADSRQVRPGDLFLACAVGRRHGGEFIAEALAAGAVAVVWELVGEQDEALPPLPRVGVPVIGITAPSGWAGWLAGEVAARFYDRPAASLAVLGITGTNGKSSCCHYLAQCLESTGRSCGVIGTLGYGRHDALSPAGHTTPDAVTLQRLLAEMRDQGCSHVAMEVSSHALDQGRVAGVDFKVALFTNLSHEHQDYHGDMDSYARSKARLFQLPGLRHAVLNGDDERGRELLAALPAGVAAVAYGLDGGLAELARRRDSRWLRGRVTADGTGLHIRIEGSWGSGELRSSLLGTFNAANLLGTLAVLLVLDMPLEVALRALAGVSAVPGRMERFGGRDGHPLVVVDYAHTPAALKAVLETLKIQCRGRLWCVFGCGGERDRAKRPEMGAVAEHFADRVVITDDNPRGEDPAAIVAEILGGMVRPEAAEVISDRAAAIAHAVGNAAAADIVLVAGKGHEDYQLVAGRRLVFSDREYVARLTGGAV